MLHNIRTHFIELRPHYIATLRLGIPIAIGQIGVIVMGFADTMMVGRYSTDALAAASFVNNIFTFVSFLLMGYSYGLTPLIGALIGQGRKRKAGSVLRSALIANAAYCALTLLVMGTIYFFLHRLGQPDSLLPLIRPYYLIMLASMAFVMLINVLRQFTDATTDTTTGMWALLSGNVLNIAGNALLIYGLCGLPEMGLIGAGLSTLFARFATAAILAGVLLRARRYRPCRLGFAAGKSSLRDVMHINRQSLPVSLQMGMESGAFTFSAVMAGWMGKIELASYQVLVTIGTLGFLFYYSFGAGASIRVSAFYGQNDLGRVQHSATAGRDILLVMASCSSLVFFLFGKDMLGMFTTDAAVIASGISLIPALILYQFGDALQICYANVLRGTSHVMSMMWVAFVSYLVVNIPVAYLLAFVFDLGLHGIFFAFTIGLVTASVLFFLQYRKAIATATKAA